MKPSETHLGQAIQLFLIKQGYQIDALARQLEITSEGLSNLIHGRRRFRDETLERLAQTPIFQQGQFSFQRLKALRAMDEYCLNELILAVVEYVKSGEVERLPKDFFVQFQEELDRNGFPPALADKRHALLEIIQSSPL